jgi:hypothetical protein
MALTANDVVTPLEKLSLSSFSNGLTNDTEVSDHFCDRSCLLSLACTCEVSLTHNLDHRQENLTLISLPNEILDVIALYLRASDKIRSLSNLGLCCKRLRGVTERLVWKEVMWKKDTWLRLATGPEKDFPAGWQFVE